MSIYVYLYLLLLAVVNTGPWWHQSWSSCRLCNWDANGCHNNQRK